MDETDTIEDFYGVYLLYCLNPKYLGRNYIGYTVNPNRRIKQHNKGKQYGGAWRTSNRGPWKMVLIVHGFPNEILALKFEWAWQHPHDSRHLKHVPKKKTREKVYDYHLRVLSEMLNTNPWNLLPLTIRWLEQEFSREFPAQRVPPVHMPICYGPVVTQRLKKDELNKNVEFIISKCFICKEIIESGRELRCLFDCCSLISHIICLSKNLLKPGEYIPVEGTCPKCKNDFLWGELIRKYKGCYKND